MEQIFFTYRQPFQISDLIKALIFLAENTSFQIQLTDIFFSVYFMLHKIGLNGVSPENMSNNYSDAFAEMGLSESAARILEHSYDGILVTLKDSRIIFVNNAYSRVLGVPHEKLLGRKLSQIEPDSITLKVLESGQEAIHVSDHVTTLNEWIFGSVLLLPSPENFVGSISIITKLHQKLTQKDDYGTQINIEAYMDQELSREKSIHPSFSNIIGRDARFRQTLFRANKASKADFPVLVIGESGTGKELIVRAIHKTSHRRNHKFVALNCASLPSTLVESELFGYEGGSFTDASRHGRKGLFDLAHKGVLFFDELGDFELSTQAKILRVLEEKVFRRIGGKKDIHINTRIISATNKDLEAMIIEGRFREDLFYRINTMIIQVPPLRERGQDLELLANYFLTEFCRQYQKKAEFTTDSMEILYRHDWPGNVRELRGAINYATNMTDTVFIAPKDLPPYLTLSKAKVSLSKALPLPVQDKKSKSRKNHTIYKNIMDSFERDLIETTLKQSRNRTDAMRLLGLSRRAFYLKLNKHGLI